MSNPIPNKTGKDIDLYKLSLKCQRASKKFKEETKYAKKFFFDYHSDSVNHHDIENSFIYEYEIFQSLSNFKIYVNSISKEGLASYIITAVDEIENNAECHEITNIPSIMYSVKRWKIWSYNNIYVLVLSDKTQIYRASLSDGNFKKLGKLCPEMFLDDSRLIKAARINALDVAIACINYGSNVNERDNVNRSALWIACERFNLAMIKMLLEKGADASQKDDYDNTTIHAIVKYNKEPNALVDDSRIDIIKQLVKGGARVNDKDHRGRIPLFYAIKYSYIEIVKVLVECGSNVMTLNPGKQNCLEYASYIFKKSGKPFCDVYDFMSKVVSREWNPGKF